MTRRRLILAACVAVVALGAAWWLTADRLTADEQRLVGKWRPGPDEPEMTWEFNADRSFMLTSWGIPGKPRNKLISRGGWRVQGDKLIVDHEQSSIRRILRPVARVIRLQIAPVASCQVESRSTDELVFVHSTGHREVWTRDRGD